MSDVESDAGSEVGSYQGSDAESVDKDSDAGSVDRGSDSEPEVIFFIAI